MDNGREKRQKRQRMEAKRNGRTREMRRDEGREKDRYLGEDKGEGDKKGGKRVG